MISKGADVRGRANVGGVQVSHTGLHVHVACPRQDGSASPSVDMPWLASVDSLNWHLKICSIIGASDVNCPLCPTCRSLISAILLLIKYARALHVACFMRRVTRSADLVSERDRSLSPERWAALWFARCSDFRPRYFECGIRLLKTKRRGRSLGSLLNYCRCIVADISIVLTWYSIRRFTDFQDNTRQDKTRQEAHLIKAVRHSVQSILIIFGSFGLKIFKTQQTREWSNNAIRD